MFLISSISQLTNHVRQNLYDAVKPGHSFGASSSNLEIRRGAKDVLFGGSDSRQATSAHYFDFQPHALARLARMAWLCQEPGCTPPPDRWANET
jgi:hypothetical protein